ncbi:restriction endonuclease subunit S [Actinomyces urogenitalis]|uniref:restriction endonuclease subunit S n=1 Tax=Actinomyces urogenitalis TaxID=103621 RepID=UPI00290652BC|nr:restriction endonuclease subunit S [Actinomyces urogenitalis]MDU5428305.1 restriction endonuclease subunit S [Actinomyces urogenitalis]
MSVLETLDFQPMFITDVFDSMKPAGKWFDLAKAERHGSPVSPYVARSGGSNGIVAFLPPQSYDAPNAGNAISIGVSTSTVFYQPVAFYTSKEIQVLRHRRLTSGNALVLVAILREQMSKFQWGNGASIARLQATRIMVPALTSADGTFEADWDGMDRLGAELLDQVVTHTHSARETRSSDDDTLPELRFGPMRIGELFTLHRGKQGIPAGVSYGGKTPYVAAASRNNSQVGWVKEDALFPGGWLAIVNTGAGGVGYCTYQPVPFWASNNVTALEPRQNDLTADALVMMASIIRFQCFGFYRYGSIANNRRVTNQRIMVPVFTDASGEDVVDWEGMSAYGRALRVRAERSLTPVLGEAS